MSRVEPDDLETGRGPLAWDAIRIATIATLGILALVIAALIFFLMTYVSTQRLTVECLQAQVDELNDSYIAARDAARQDRQSQRELLLTQGESREERIGAVRKFLTRLDEADEARSASPPPTRRCT